MTAGPSDDEPMERVTFTVPVRIDSGDRLDNLLAVLGHLRRTYPSRILVGSEEPASLTTVVPDGVEVVGIDGDIDLPFHHTRMLNDLARLVATPVLVNIETDIIIPPPQLREAVRLTATGAVDLVLPYDYAVDVRRKERAAFAAGEVTAVLADGRKRWHWAVIGGCMVWNTASFVRVGMENEHFVSWGLEDDERIVRVEKLGGVFRRVPGPLFHMQHHRGPDSSYRTAYYPSNQIELRRVRSISAGALAEEVAGWPWLRSTTSARPPPVPADDLTVLIPVRLDNGDRYRNLFVVVRTLRNTTTARIIVGVGDTEPLAGLLPEGVEVVPVDDPPGPFHRTRILNELARRADSDLIALHDADVVATPGQWREALALLRAGTDLVLPYDGVMRDRPYAHHPWLERAAYSSIPPFSMGVLHPDSVGGCVLWRRESFRDAGMENEHFVSWGCEDDERVTRACTLGLGFARVGGELTHLHHDRGPDSTVENPHYEANAAESRRIAAMDAAELRAEVARWRWCAPDASGVL